MVRRAEEVLLDQEHAAISGTTLRLGLAPVPAVVARVRRLVDCLLDDVLPAPDRRTAVLLTSELVTNAVVHARTDVGVEVVVRSGVVRVTVTDGSPDRVESAPAKAPPGAEGGRGLLLVEALAAAWGTEALLGGKRVWFELLAPTG